MYFLSLFFAIICEIAGTVCMKFSDGGSKFLPVLGVIFFYVLSIATLAYSTKKIDLSVAYSIWCGGAIIGIALIDYFYFHTSGMASLKIVFLLCIFIGIVGLYIFDS